mmetsp:Transcript_16101/g.24058  ORF Transcript_16101/g.24058 Transcript_16101/m.24058 type:complete len:143 (-) Transcript_16101:632-1060(-)
MLSIFVITRLSFRIIGISFICQDCNPQNLNQVHPQQSIFYRNQSISDTVNERPKLQSTDQQGNRRSLHVTKDLSRLLQLHDPKQKYVAIIPYRPKHKLIHNYFRYKIPPCMQVQNVVKKSPRSHDTKRVTLDHAQSSLLEQI